MSVNKERPVNLDLGSIKFPITAIASILHRISGFAIFILLPLLLWVFHMSVASEESFNQLQEVLGYTLVKLALWAVLAALMYHLAAGIKHLLMDIGIGETLEGGKTAAALTLGIAAILILLVGGMLW